MPLIDGIEATRLIRALEIQDSVPPCETVPLETSLTASSPTAPPAPITPQKRIPIIAVSASLAEHRIEEYMNAGFDGWILKPIDFKRLEAILVAVDDSIVKEEVLHGVDVWERGGWFKKAPESL